MPRFAASVFRDGSIREGIPMPIRASLRWFYPIDWPQLSREIRFGRGRGRCETCSRRHGTKVLCLPNGRWFDRDETCWRDGHGKPPWGIALDQLRVTRVILAVAHLDHDPGNSAPANFKSLFQQWHFLHGRPYHRAQQWRPNRLRWTIGDLFLGPYARGDGGRRPKVPICRPDSLD
jgi:hypothetical protein